MLKKCLAIGADHESHDRTDKPSFVKPAVEKGKNPLPCNKQALTMEDRGEETHCNCALPATLDLMSP